MAWKTSCSPGRSARSETDTNRITIGLTLRRTARKIRRLKGVVGGMCPSYSDSADPRFPDALYVMDWASIWIEIVGGLLIAGALAAWVPHAIWTGLFLSNDPVWSKVVGPLIGPIVAVISFVCSVGNVPLAVVLWSGGISFGGVVAFLFADLIVLPIVNIYRKYYGLRVAMLLFVLFYAAMAGAGYVVELVFGVLGLV